jgi:hypothetical protein
MGTGVQLQLPRPSGWKSRARTGGQRLRRAHLINGAGVLKGFFRLGKWRAPPSLLLFGEQWVSDLAQML